MAKEQLSRTQACATKTLYAVMQEMARRGGSDKFSRLIDGDEFIEM
jgi:hypothetical protein